MSEAEIINDADQRMNKSLEALKHELIKIRTGRAHPGLIEHIAVSCYGAEVPLNQAANISVQDARTLAVTAWDKSLVGNIEKAILNSGLGLNPVSAGDVIRVPLPALTEERRKDLTKVVRSEAEKGRIAIRGIRRDANHSMKEMVKNKEISEDDERRGEEQIQKLTDSHIKEVDKMLGEKENELMEI